MKKLITQASCASTLLLCGFAYAAGDLTMSGTSDDNISWTSQPSDVRAQTTSSFSFNKTNPSNDTMSTQVDYEIEETDYEYSFSILVKAENDTASCQVIDDIIGEPSTEEGAVWYSVEAKGNVDGEGNYFCDVNVDRHIADGGGGGGDDNYYFKSLQEKTFNTINKIGTFKFGEQNLMFVLEDKRLIIHSLVPYNDDYRNDVIAGQSEAIGTTSEIFTDVKHFELYGNTYLVLAASNPQNNTSKVYIYKGVNNSGMFKLQAENTIVLEDVKDIQDIEFIPNGSINYAGYLAITPKGSRSQGYIQQIRFYRIHVSDNTAAPITADHNKILGLHAQETVYYVANNQHYLLVVNHNDPTSYKVDSELCPFEIVDNNIKVLECKAIPTNAAKQAIHFSERVGTDDIHNYIAIAEAGTNSDGASLSQIFKQDSDDSLNVKYRIEVSQAVDGTPYQWLDYKISGDNYLMLVTDKTGVANRIYSWVTGELSVYNTGEEDPVANGTQVNWEFTDLGKNGNPDYYLFAAQVENGTTVPNTIRTYQVKFK